MSIAAVISLPPYLLVVVRPQAVAELVRQGQHGLRGLPLLAVVQQSDDPGVLPRPAQRPPRGQARRAVVEVSEDSMGHYKVVTCNTSTTYK